MANVLDPYYLTEMVRNLRVDITKFQGAQILTGGADLKTELGQTIEYDITYDETGMTPATQPNDPSPIRAKQKVDHANFTNQEWREKKIIDRAKIQVIRAPGTNLERLYAEEYMTDSMVELNQRLETRLEWLRWQVLTGTLNIPATVNMPARTLNYNVPSSQKPTAATLWSNTASANPLADIDNWKLLFRGTGARPTKIIVNAKVDSYLKQNSNIQNLIRNLYGRDLVAADVLKDAIKTTLDGLEYIVYDDGYFDDGGTTFYPFIPDNACIIVGEGTTGNLMDLVSSPNNYADMFNGEVGKFALTKMIPGDPDEWSVINGVTALPRLRHVNWHVYATIA